MLSFYIILLSHILDLKYHVHAIIQSDGNESMNTTVNCLSILTSSTKEPTSLYDACISYLKSLNAFADSKLKGELSRIYKFIHHVYRFYYKAMQFSFYQQ